MSITINSKYTSTTSTIKTVSSSVSKLSAGSKIESGTQLKSKKDEFVSSQTDKTKLVSACNTIIATKTAQECIKSNKSIEEYKEAFKEDFYNSLKFNVDRGLTTIQNKADILNLLETKYNGYKSSAISAAVIENNNEALNLYGNDARDGAYYNSDYYYACEDLKDALSEAYQELSKEFSLDQTEVPDTTQHDNFNDLWSQVYQNKTDFNVESAGTPPEDFEMYYQPQKYSTSEFQSGDTYRFLAESNTANGNGGVIYLTIPNNASLLNSSSNLTLKALESLLSNSNTQSGTTTYDISSLISGYSGTTIEEQLASFIVDNCINEQAGFISVNCGDWSIEQEIPFSSLTDTHYYNGSNLALDSDNKASNYLGNFIFKK